MEVEPPLKPFPYLKKLKEGMEKLSGKEGTVNEILAALEDVSADTLDWTDVAGQPLWRAQATQVIVDSDAFERNTDPSRPTEVVFRLK